MQRLQNVLACRGQTCSACDTRGRVLQALRVEKQTARGSLIAQRTLCRNFLFYHFTSFAVCSSFTPTPLFSSFYPFSRLRLKEAPGLGRWGRPTFDKFVYSIRTFSSDFDNIRNCLWHSYNVHKSLIEIPTIFFFFFEIPTFETVHPDSYNISNFNNLCNFFFLFLDDCFFLKIAVYIKFGLKKKISEFDFPPRVKSWSLVFK